MAGFSAAYTLRQEICFSNASHEEKVSAGFNIFGDFSLNIKLNYYIKKGEDILETETAFNLEIMRRFAEEKLELAFPTQTVYTLSAEKCYFNIVRV